MNRLAHLGNNQRGVATIEFAILTSLFFMVIMVALDLAMYINYRERLVAAVEQASVVAFNQKATHAGDAQSLMQNYIRTAANLPGSAIVVTTYCNGVQNGCVNSATPPAACVNATPTAPLPAACSSSATPGYYFTVKAEYTYQPVVLRAGILNNKVMSQQTTVRLPLS